MKLFYSSSSTKVTEINEHTTLKADLHAANVHNIIRMGGVL